MARLRCNDEEILKVIEHKGTDPLRRAARNDSLGSGRLLQSLA